MHPSIIEEGNGLKCTTLSSSVFACPVCPKFITKSESVIKRHLLNHAANAVHFKEKIICRCNLPCRNGGHFHCPSCGTTIIRKGTIMTHFIQCKNKFDMAQLTSAPPSQLPSPETHPTVLSSMSVEHAYTLSSSASVVTIDHSYTRTASQKTPDLSQSTPAPTSVDPIAPKEEVTGDVPPTHGRCPHCPVVLYKRNLFLHIQTKHGHLKDTISQSHLQSTSVDQNNSLYAARKTSRGSSVPVPVQRKTWEQQHVMRCVQQQFVIKEEVPHEGSPSMDQKNPEPLHIKEEEEELLTCWNGEQLHGVEEPDITRFAFTAVTVKSEDDEEKPQTSQLHQSLTEDNREAEPPTSSSATQIKTETDGEDCGESEPARNRDPDGFPPLNIDESASDCSETDVSSGDWQESLPDSGSGCDVCGKKFSRRYDLKRHKRVHTEEKLFCCEHCGKRFFTLSHFNRHMRVHTGEKPFGCDDCGKRFNDRGNLQQHRRVHTGEKPFGCDDCGKRFSQQSNLKAHMRLHTGEKPFACEPCGKRFSNKSHFNRHERIHTGEKPFGCDDWGNFQNHMRVHTREKPFACDDCGKRFSRQTDVEAHMTVHTGVKPHGCDFCGMRFTYKTNLKAHMRVHTGDKPFSCDLCGIRFAFKTSLANHVRVHTGEKPFGCADCGKRFTQKIVLRTHMRIHTGERPFGCDVCGKSFTQQGNLKKHMKLH